MATKDETRSFRLDVREPQTTNLFLLQDLEDVGRTSELSQSDREALHAVADWIKTFVAKPHKDLAALGPSVPSCLGPWNVIYFG